MFPPNQNSSAGTFDLITVFRRVKASLIITFFTVSPSDCKLSSSISSYHTVSSPRLPRGRRRRMLNLRELLGFLCHLNC